MDQNRLHNLDAMRGVCALTVVLFHCDGLFAKGEIFCHGFLAVDLFFILSGFVIARTYEERLTNGLGLLPFMRARLTRLGPVYWAGTALGTAALVAVAAFRPSDALFNPAFLAFTSVLAFALLPQVFVHGPAYPTNSAAWSLFGEVFVNVVYGRWLFRLSTPALLLIAAPCWAVCSWIALHSPHGWCFGAQSTEIWLAPFKAVPAFIAGIVLYRLWRGGNLVRLPQIAPLPVLILWAVIAEVPTHGPMPIFEMIVVILVSPLLIALLVRAPEVAPKPFLWLGAISYPLYASHLSLVLLAHDTPLFGFQRGPQPLVATAGLGLALAVAWAIHRLIEARHLPRNAVGERALQVPAPAV